MSGWPKSSAAWSGLTEPPSDPRGAADERLLGPELDEHAGRDLAGERALLRPVDILRVDRPFLADRDLERHERRAQDHVDPVGRREAVEERERLGRALEHLPVAGN